MSLAHYNENDPKAAAWLRELIAQNQIAPGEVDTRDIQTIPLDELDPNRQTHFFAGIGGWSLSLRLAGVPDNAPVWTGSCPCQPFSVAGKRRGKRDPRHLWPAFRSAIAHARPAIVFGEQVASKAGRLWLDGIRADLEALDYAVGSADLCAAGVGAPHIRQRLFWVAYERRWRCKVEIFQPRNCIAATSEGRTAGLFGTNRTNFRLADGASFGRGELNAGHQIEKRPTEPHRLPDGTEGRRSIGRLAESTSLERKIGRVDVGSHSRPQYSNPSEPGEAFRLVNTDGSGRGELRGTQSIREKFASIECAGSLGVWNDCDIIYCRDGKWRRVESGTFPLAHGIPGRVGLLRGYGNAIVPLLAAEFIQASLEAIFETERDSTRT